MIDPLPLLAAFLRVEGITGAEAAILAEAEKYGNVLDLPCEANEAGIVVRLRGTQPGARLLLCSHLDTVPAGEGWVHPPFGGEIEDGVCYGRGAVDARGCCLAMLMTAVKIQAEGLAAGELIVALSIGEEGNDPSLPVLLNDIGPVTAGVVGEPTLMRIATAQRGLMIVDLLTTGEQAHAARSQGPNAIFRLTADLERLAKLDWPREDARLGHIRLTPTRLSAGVADNVTPPRASCRLDIRTTPAYSHAEIAVLLTRHLDAAVEVVADRWIPCAIDESHSLVAAALAAVPGGETFASDAASDWWALQANGIAAIKMGPGDPQWSHRPDERISREQLQTGIDGYVELVRRFCGGEES